MTEGTSVNKSDNNLIFRNVCEVDERTEDVLGEGTFEQLMIHPTIIEKLNRHGFQRPSPVQAKAIPLGLLGMDLLVQAKTGTGKTLVFGVMCADHLLNADSSRRGRPQPLVMVVSPTREIAMQSYEVLRKLTPPNFYSSLIVGGVDIEKQRNQLQRGLHVVVGTSGRLAHLVKCRQLNPKHISLFVLDEADKLMDDSFRAEINFLFSSLTPNSAQICVLSATYPREIADLLCTYMKEPSLVRLNVDDVQLIGVKQYALVDFNRDDIDILVDILTSVSFAQCLIFTNDGTRCQAISERLEASGVRNAYISSSLAQDERFKVMKNFRNYKLRVLISTDLSARGIDAEHVNLVVNIECPTVSANYLHRIGRAGRFGTRGAALTILATDRDLHYFRLLVRRERLALKLINVGEGCPIDFPTNVDYYERARSFETLFDEYGNRSNTKRLTSTVSSDDDDQDGKGNGSAKSSVAKSKTIVPQRAGKGTKYYLRCEMLAIRDLATPEKWRAFALDRLECCTKPELAAAIQPILWSTTMAVGSTPATWADRATEFPSRPFKKKQYKSVNRWQPFVAAVVPSPSSPPPASKIAASLPPKQVRPPQHVPLRPRVEYHAYIERIMRQMDEEMRILHFELRPVPTTEASTSTMMDQEVKEAAAAVIEMILERIDTLNYAAGGDARSTAIDDNDTTTEDQPI